MSMTFRYKTVPRPDPFPPDPSPSVPVTLSSGARRVEVVALLDSGADTTALPRGIGDILNLDLDGKREEVGGIRRAEAVTVHIEIGIQKGHERYSIPAQVKVILDADVDIPVLLGRKDFFEAFAIEFRERDQRVILRRAL